MMRLLIISTRLTPEMAASPQRETIIVSAMPTVTSSSCSTSSGPVRSSSSFWVNSGFRPPNRIFSLVIVRSIEFLTFCFPGRRAQKGPAPLLPSLQATVPHFNMLVFILTHPVSVVKNPSAGFADSFPTHVFLRMFPVLGELVLSVLPRMSCQFCAL